MSYCVLFYLLLALAIFFGLYFAYNTANDENEEFDFIGFLKILGLFLLCGIVLGVFLDIFFFVARFALAVLTVIMDFFREQIFARKTGGVLSLLAINVIGGYLFWEMRKEKQENVESDFEAPEPVEVKSESATEVIEIEKEKAEEVAPEVTPEDSQEENKEETQEETKEKTQENPPEELTEEPKKESQEEPKEEPKEEDVPPSNGDGSDKPQ